MSVFDPATYQWAKGEKNWHTKYNNALSAIKTFLGVEHNADGTHTASASTPVDFKASGHTPVYISSSSFKIAGLDVSGTYVVGRRLKITLSGGDVYCTVKTVAFSTDTTITTEETTITNTISAVAYGIVSHGSTGSMPKHNHSDDATGGNLGPVVNALTSKATPVDNDEIPLADSAASFALKKLSWANLKAVAKTYFDTLYLTNTAAAIGDAIAGATAKTTPVDADIFAISDSAASDDMKKLSFANLKAKLPPALSGFVALKESPQSLAASTWTKITWTSKVYDIGGEFTSDTFTNTIAGKYLVMVRLAFDMDATKECLINIKLNGSNNFYGNLHSSVVDSLTITSGGIMHLIPGDTLEVWGLHTNAGAKNVAGTSYQSYFCINRLS